MRIFESTSVVDLIFLPPILVSHAPHERHSTRTMFVSDFCPRLRRSVENSKPNLRAFLMALRASVREQPATAAIRARHHVHAPERWISPATTVMTACSPCVN